LHVNTEFLEEISATTDVQPSWKTIRAIQDKYLQKEHLKKFEVETAQSVPLSSATKDELAKAAQTLGLPLMLKSRREAYDGKGNFPVKSEADFDAALKALGANKDLYAEKWSHFKMELAVMVVKTKDGVLSYPTVETIHENSICKLTYSPARGVRTSTRKRKRLLARPSTASGARVSLVLRCSCNKTTPFSSTKSHPDRTTLDTTQSKHALSRSTMLI